MPEPVPTPFGSFPAALPALTQLRATSLRDADVSGLTGLRRLAVAPYRSVFRLFESCSAVEGLSGLTALEDLRLEGSRSRPMARASDLAPLKALTRLAMTCVPADLASSPVAARLRRLELQAFGPRADAPGAGGGGGGGGGRRGAPAALAALAALAQGAPLLERLRIIQDDDDDSYDEEGGDEEEEEEEDDADDGSDEDYDHPGGGAFGNPLGPGVAWPSLTHLQVSPWAAVLLAGCTFPRLSRLVAMIGVKSFVSNARLQAALVALAAKARDHAALLGASGHDKLDLAAVPGLRHLSWYGSGTAGDWARLAATLQSLELRGPLDACVEALAALTGLTSLSLSADSHDGRAPAEGAPARVACVLAGLPRLAHLRLSSPTPSGIVWGSPAVAAALARCPALRLLEVEPPNDPLWRHELGPAHTKPRMPRPSPLWQPFAEALRAGGCRATVRPAPDFGFEEEFDFDV
jgi:hypothetical protein